MPKDIFDTPMVVDSKTGTYVPVEGYKSNTAYARKVECAACGWEGTDADLAEPDSEGCPQCDRNYLYELPDTDAVNTVLSKMEAYVFVAMLASFTLGGLVGRLWY